MIINGSSAVLHDSDGRKITVSLQTIAPEEAQQRLKHMAHNRPCKMRKVIRLAAAMKEGSYMLNGQPLIEDSSASTLDGQHRLAACVESGIPFRTLVVQGVAPDVFATLDTFERKLNETLVAEYSMDIAKASLTASVINLSYAIKNSRNILSKDFPSPWTALAFYNAERKDIDLRTTEAVEKFKIKIIPTAKLVALWHEFARNNSDVGRNFFMAMCGQNDGVAQFTALREMFLADMPKRAKLKIAPRLKLAYCIKAFNAVVAGESVQFKMKRGEAFPVIGNVPGEDAIHE